MRFHWHQKPEYLVAKTNGNWIDWQTHVVEVTNPYTLCSNNSRITIFFNFSECEIGITEIKGADFPFSVLPNPGNGMFSIEGSKDLDILDIQVFDANGSALIEKNYKNLNQNWRKSIDLTEFANGIYFFLINADGETYSVRAIKN